MLKLTLESIGEDKPVKLSVELPAAVHRDLKTYAELLAQESGQQMGDPMKLIAPMLKRFMATDRSFSKFRRQMAQERGG